MDALVLAWGWRKEEFQKVPWDHASPRLEATALVPWPSSSFAEVAAGPGQATTHWSPPYCLWVALRALHPIPSPSAWLHGHEDLMGQTLCLRAQAKLLCTLVTLGEPRKRREVGSVVLSVASSLSLPDHPCSKMALEDAREHQQPRGSTQKTHIQKTL